MEGATGSSCSVENAELKKQIIKGSFYRVLGLRCSVAHRG